MAPPGGITVSGAVPVDGILPRPTLCARSGPGAIIDSTYGQNMYLSDVSGDEGTGEKRIFIAKRKAAIRAPTFYEHQTIINYKVIEAVPRYWIPLSFDSSGDVVTNVLIPCPRPPGNALVDPAFDARVKNGIFPVNDSKVQESQLTIPRTAV